MNSSTSPASLSEIFSVFFRLGVLGFGGPAAHIAMMRQEVVEKKNWLSEQEFLDLLGATQLIPGPNSTELAIHIGHHKGGWKGLVVAGCSFIFPAFVCVLALAVFYAHYGALPEIEPILAGIRPVIMAIILDALWKFRKSAVPQVKVGVVALIALILAILGVNEILLILGLALVYALALGRSHLALALPLVALPSASIPITGSSVFYFFLKIGSVLFGSGYVLLAFLQAELVEGRMWLTEKQLLDAITVGQITPGPVFTTATFIGYLLQSYQGAVLATLGIFLPSFFFVALSAPFLKHLRSSVFFGRFLDGINAASFALLLKVSFDLGQKAFINPATIIIGCLSLFIFLKFKNVNSIWTLLAAAVFGWLFL